VKTQSLEKTSMTSILLYKSDINKCFTTAVCHPLNGFQDGALVKKG